MNNYLLQILKETKTIIIPGIGALTVTNETTGEIMFMSFLKHDDGNLAKYIAEKEGMDLNDAKNLVAKYVREIQAEVDKGDKYSMYQFGAFSKVDGEIVFDQWEANAPADATPEPETIEENVVPVVEIPEVKTEPEPEVIEEASPVIAEKAPEPIIEESIIDEIVPVVEIPAEETIIPETTPVVEEAPTPKAEQVIPEKKDEPVKEEIKPQEPIIAEEKPKIEVPPIVVVETPLEPVIPAKKAEAVTTPKTKSPKEQLKAADQKKATDKKKKKTGVFAYILWGIVILILGGGTYVAIQYDTLKKDFPILAELTGEDLNEDKKDSLVSLGESDPVANPDSMPEVETVPGSELETTEPESMVDDSKTTPKVETEKPKKVEPVKKPEVKPTPEPVVKPKPVVKPAPKPVAKPKPTPKPVVTTPTVTTTYKPRPKPATFPTPNLSNPYHIIAGSFSSKTNAQHFATKLKGMGMSNLSIGEAGGLYKVSINGYATEEAAKSAAAGVQNVAPGAWVFEWK